MLQRQVRELEIDSRIIFHGEADPEEMAAHYHSNDLLVLPSHQEGQGMVVAEAMSFGLPVIVTRSGGPEYFVDNNNGIVCPPANPEALAAGIEKMISKPDRELTAMGLNGRQCVIQRFDIEHIADRLLERFAEAVHGNERT
jgi:glycosyltransferase involved in cell wall biosynthesis